MKYSINLIIFDNEVKLAVGGCGQKLNHNFLPLLSSFCPQAPLIFPLYLLINEMKSAIFLLTSVHGLMAQFNRGRSDNNEK